MRSRGEYLGSVEAPDDERAEALAIKRFDRTKINAWSGKLTPPEGTLSAQALVVSAYVGFGFDSRTNIFRRCHSLLQHRF
jgi:hypothetical protein